MAKERMSKLQQTIIQSLNELNEKEKDGLHERWTVKENVQVKYMKSLGMKGYDTEKSFGENLKKNPKWQKNPKLKYFFVVRGKFPYCFDKRKKYFQWDYGNSFSVAFFNSVMNLVKKELVEIEKYKKQLMKREYPAYRRSRKVPDGEPIEMKEIALIKLTQRGKSLLLRGECRSKSSS